MRTCEDCNQKIAKVSLDLGMINKCICFDCYNKMMAEELGVTIVDHPERVILRDTNGVERVFNIQKRIYPNGILLEQKKMFLMVIKLQLMESWMSTKKNFFTG